MRRSVLLALIIATVVAGAAAACHHHDLDDVVANWLSSRLPMLQDLHRLPALQHSAYAVAAVLAAWFSLALTGFVRRAGFVLGLVFLLLTLWPVLAWQGVFFEPFISAAAALLAGGIAMLMDVASQRRAQAAAAFAGRLRRSDFSRWWRQQAGRSAAVRVPTTALTCRLLNEAALLKTLEPAVWQELANESQRWFASKVVNAGAYLEDAAPGRMRFWFGFPHPDENHAVNAARAALEVRRQLDEWEAAMEKRWGQRPRYGIALTSGDAVATAQTVGLHTHWRLSAAAGDLGDQLALENARFGSRLLLSAATHQSAADGLEVRPLDLVPQGDSNARSEIYELLALKQGLSEDQVVARDAFWQGIILLRKGDREGARRQFERARLDGVADATLAYFAELTRASEKPKN